MKKDLETEVDDSWRRKGHIHEETLLVPKVCPVCKGVGAVDSHMHGEIECFNCGGEGVVYD